MVHGFGREDRRLTRGYGRGRVRLAAGHPREARPGDGRHGHERQLRHRLPYAEGGLSMARYGMTVDEKLCVTCNACVHRLQDRERGARGRGALLDGAGRARHLPPALGGDAQRALQPLRERALRRAPAPPGASHYVEGGIVVVDPDKCVGCKACIIACPYEVRYLHPDGYVDKCTFCVHRVQAGARPGVRRGVPDRARSPSATSTIRAPRSTSSCSSGSTEVAQARRGHPAQALLPHLRAPP